MTTIANFNNIQAVTIKFLGGIVMKETKLISANNLIVNDQMTIEIMDEVRTVFICTANAWDMTTNNSSISMHTCMEAIIANVDDIPLATSIVNGEPVNHVRAMKGDIIFAASDKFVKDFWLKFDKKKQAMMIHIIIARTAALMSGVTCMTDLYDKVMLYMNAIISKDNCYSRGKVVAALKKINAYEESFCKKYLNDLKKANIGLTAEFDDEVDFGEYDDDECYDECCG